MTTPSSALSQGIHDNFDTGPLSWVMGEIRETLARSKGALDEALTVEADARPTSLRHAKSHLHQAHGALQIVDIDGVAIITETVEDLLDRIDSGQIALNQTLVEAVGSGYQALVEYLEELMSGMPHQPVRLFPYYRALLEARGAERIHPADLFFPNLAIRPQLPASAPSGTIGREQYAALRQRYERALLPFLKGGDRKAELANVASMRDIVGEIERCQDHAQSRAFWWVMHGFAEAVADGQIENELYVKQLFARINLQIRRLSQGSSSIAERLLRDALFFLAQAREVSPRGSQIRSAYQLDGSVPADYREKRYGQINLEALATAKERLTHAKSFWNRIAGGDASVADSFEHEMHGLVQSGATLNSAPLTKLLRELGGISRHAAHASPGDALGLEMATSLLFIENTLANIGRLPDNFGERADAMTARLLSVVSGETPAEAAQWLDDMSREAQQRQTMVALTGEMQNSLRQVEKMLDEYFRDTAQHAALGELDSILHQIEGALAVLDQDDAVRAIRHTRMAVKRFADVDPEEPVAPTQQECQQVAQNVGALSFFIEALQLNSESARKQFAFDDARGVFEARLLEKASEPVVGLIEDESGSVGDTRGNPAGQATSLPTVENELALTQQQLAELALSLTEQPDNSALQEQLKESLEQLRQDATLVDNPEVNDRAQTGIDILQRPDFSASRDAMAEIITATAPVQTSSQQVQLPPVVAPQTDEAIDAELLEIFLGEAEEVLACVRETIPESRQAPHDQEHLTTLRRSFHTLKGSGRMVGLIALGEAAWSIEQVLNVRLSEARPGDTYLYDLLDKAAEVLGAWVEDLQTQGRSDRTPQALMDAAERVKSGAGFQYADLAPSMPADMLKARSQESDQAGASGSMESAACDEPLPAVEPAIDDALVDTLSTLQVVEEVAMSDEDMAMFQSAAQESQPPVATPVEVADRPVAPLPEARHDDNVKRIGHLEISVPLHNIYLAETDELVRLLSQDIAEWRHEPERQVNVFAVHAAHSLAGSSATVGFMALQEVAHALERVLQFLGRTPISVSMYEFDILEHSVERLKLMLQTFALGEMPVHEPEFVRLLTSLRNDMERRSVSSPPVAPVQSSSPELLQSSDETGEIVPAARTEEQTPDRVSEAPFDEPVFAGQNDESVDPAMVLRDELDADLLPVFLEEGRDMLPQMGEALRGWQSNSGNAGFAQSLLRVLHTLKGSARMAGAMSLGQHLHDMETRIENLMRLGAPAPVAIDELLVRYDEGLRLFDELQNPDAHKLAAASDAAALPAGEEAVDHAVVLAPLMPVQHANPVPARPVERAVAAPATPAPLVRVRADILDRLVNQAGEVSISRSKLETEVGTLRGSLSELTENVGRLREQLREIEMQAETQITSRMAHSADREFDPLEFDRFTRLQELTRMMAESVNDVASVQQNLSRTLDSASGGLLAQARLTRDLQQDLMRVRMVQFASISERLFRVTRQASKEVDKRVNLDIRGSAVEIDRGVLEKMVGPFEHLLRNAIVHGIESREARRAAGKSEIGELLVEIRQEGNEVVIQFSDDGQGLNIDRIRDKALGVGLLTDESHASDDEVADLIFHSGFSTAEEVTELAGRGVGMDVVRSEAAALGGRVATQSQRGKGAQFTIHLPLTLAVTQVVLLSTGGRTYAVPSVLVEQVQQLKSQPLAAAYNDGAVTWQGQRVPLHYLSALLGDTDVAPVTQQYSPLMIVKSGNDRVALHVDEILGNREVVVKNIGPQLSRMIGIAGATVLGSGDIVLILNPVPLAQRAAYDNVRAPRILPSDAPDAMGAVAEMARVTAARPLASDAEPVQGLRTQNIVMVVDDSLTVRRVTQRLLTREGYQVVLAKDGVDALERLQSITPDVMLVDIEMPRMDGFDLTRNVRGDERTRGVPIIMITSRTASKHRNYALELGVNEYLGKPYQEEQLLALIAGFIGKETPVA